MRKGLLARLAAFAVHYDAILENERMGLRLQSWEDVRTDWWLGLWFFLNRAYYQGRRDDVSDMFRLAACQALDEVLGEDTMRTSRLLTLAREGWLKRERWNDSQNPVRRALDRKYCVEVGGRQVERGTGKARDREMVLDLLRFITERPASAGTVLNLADYACECIRAGDIPKLDDELRQIRQVGQKVSALFLRDVVAVFGLRDHLRPEHYALLQPVDTWIWQVASRLDIQATQNNLPRALVEACRQGGVDPIRFNQGAWYVGSHSFEIVLKNLGRIKP